MGDMPHAVFFSEEAPALDRQANATALSDSC
jgi:hypothetical protein